MAKHRLQRNESRKVTLSVSGSVDQVASRPSHEEIAILAFRLWQEGGCQHGQAERNWLQAEELLNNRGEKEPRVAAGIGG